MVKIYLDACALNRLTDEKSQARVRNEANAVEDIFVLLQSQKVQWIASEVLLAELRRNPDAQRQEDVLSLLPFASGVVVPQQQQKERAVLLAASGYGIFDALHLACAELAPVSALLTTDDRFIRLAERGAGNPLVEVINPVEWLRRDGPWLRNTT